MTTRTFFTFGALLALGYGLAFLVAPALVMGLYGVAVTPDLAVAYRYFGVGLVTAFVLLWPLRSVRDPAILRPMLLGHGAADIAGIVVSFTATASGTLNALGSLNVMLYFGLLGGAVYCYMTPVSRPLATV